MLQANYESEPMFTPTDREEELHTKKNKNKKR